MHSPTGMIAHYGKRYRNTGLVRSLTLPVIRFNEDDNAMVPHPGGKGYLVEYGHTAFRRTGLEFMRLTPSNVADIPDEE